MQFHWVVWLFGTFLIVTGIKMAMTSEASIDPDRNPLLKLLRRLLPSRRTSGLALPVAEGGGWVATPLLVALVCLEVTDIVFALDSVPLSSR
jgi:tellurite resistance protein TerC